MNQNNLTLAKGFPTSIQADTQFVLKNIDLDSKLGPSEPFFVKILDKELAIPIRVYINEEELENSIELSEIQQEILFCIYSRHHNGFVRELCLQKIIKSNNVWVTPYIVKLVGEYVVEIQELVLNNLYNLDNVMYKSFLKENLDFYNKTKQRVVSYWDCYYRDRFPRREDFPGVKIIEFFDTL